MSFTPKDLEIAIQKHYTDLEVFYKPDFRQPIADSWPDSISDEAAQQDWGWKPAFDLDKMIKDMLGNLKKSIHQNSTI